MWYLICRIVSNCSWLLFYKTSMRACCQLFTLAWKNWAAQGDFLHSEDNKPRASFGNWCMERKRPVHYIVLEFQSFEIRQQAVHLPNPQEWSQTRSVVYTWHLCYLKKRETSGLEDPATAITYSILMPRWFCAFFFFFFLLYMGKL